MVSAGRLKKVAYRDYY